MEKIWTTLPTKAGKTDEDPRLHHCKLLLSRHLRGDVSNGHMFFFGIKETYREIQPQNLQNPFFLLSPPAKTLHRNPVCMEFWHSVGHLPAASATARRAHETWENLWLCGFRLHPSVLLRLSNSFHLGLRLGFGLRLRGRYTRTLTLPSATCRTRNGLGGKNMPGPRSSMGWIEFCWARFQYIQGEAP